MPITAKDFKLIDSNPKFEAQVNQAFDYFRAKFPNTDSALQALIDKGMQIMYNPDGNPKFKPEDAGEDLYGHTADGKPVAIWNPAQASLVTHCGIFSGLQSPADGLAHELFGHGLNPNEDIQKDIPDAQYEKLNERVATTTESVLNAAFNEPIRDNHDAGAINVDDVTLHTVMGEDGELTLVHMGADGKDVYGPQVTYSNLERFSTPGGNNLARLTRETQNAHDTNAIDVSGHQSGHDIVTDTGTIYDVVNLANDPQLILGWWGSADNDIFITLPTGTGTGVGTGVGTPDDTSTGHIGTGLDGLGIATGNGFNHFDAGWLHHWGHLLPTPTPMPGPEPGLEAPHVTLVGITHIVHSAFA